MREAARGIRRWIAACTVLLGALACHRAPPSIEPPPVEPPAGARSGSSPAPAGTPAPERAPIDEGWALPAALLEPAPEIRIDWERPAPKGVPAAKRQPSPSQLHWGPLVNFGPSGPAPLDDVSRPCRRQHFLPHDTRPLRTVQLRYDAAGRLVAEWIDEDTDGTIDREDSWRWGADGRLEHERHRIAPRPTCAGMLGGSEVETHHRYDAQGVWIGGQVHYDGHPEPRTAWRTTEYDAEGRLVLYLVHPTYEPQQTIALRWSGAGELAERVDSVGPTPRRIERWHRAADGSRWYAAWSGRAWAVTRTVHDADGRALFAQHDADGDGEVDGRTTWRYDARGRQRAEERDGDGDGDVDETTTFEHDAAGYLVGRVHVASAGTRRETWQYDAAHRLLRWTSKLDESWVEDVEEHVYDASGRELERRIDRHHAVGSVGDVRSYVTRERWRGERDDQGRLVRAFVATGELGADERIEYAYDCATPYHHFPRRKQPDPPELVAECMGMEL